MTKKLKPTKKPNPNARKIVVPFKVNAEEMRVLLARAGGFTSGNVSEWVRYAALNFVPNKKDFEK
jgi:hypothetical protein